MNWVDASTFEDFCDRQRRRIIENLWKVQTAEDQRSPDDPESGLLYTRRELEREGILEVRK